jgi:predicted transcriptional regulator
MSTTASLSLKLPSDTRERLKTLALIKQRPAHALAREAVESYVANEEERYRRDREADEAWRHYRETGLHVTGDEVIRWLDSWGTEDELPPPECHG